MVIPIFVYGTLMPGFSNYEVYLKGKTDKELPALLKGKMYSVFDTYPAVVDGDSTIKGYLIYPKEEFAAEILKKLDDLEGCLYKRELREVSYENTPIYAWVYIWTSSVSDLVEVTSGDWVSYIQSSPTLILGDVYATPGVLEKVSQADIIKGLGRHRKCDWGDVYEEDKIANDEAFEMGYRILSSYTSSKGVKFWIITEADRSITTVLLPSEY